MSISRCCRCGDLSYEQLATHGYCIGCNYSQDLLTDEDSAATFAVVSRIVDKEECKNIPSIERASKRFTAAVNERKEMEGRYAEV